MTIFQGAITFVLVVPVLITVWQSLVDARRHPERERPPITGGSSGAGDG